jgi:hypothetical protein
MNILSCFRYLVALFLPLMCVGAAFGQSGSNNKTLVVDGHTAGTVVQIDGNSYVDVETLSRIMNAAVSFETGRVILTLPNAEAVAKPERTAPGLSKDLAKAGYFPIWQSCGSGSRDCIRDQVRSCSGRLAWSPAARSPARAEASLSQTSLVARTGSDQRALQLLKNEFTSLGEWDSNTQATIHSLNSEQSVNPAVTQNDPLLTKISEYSSFLGAMLVDREFADSPSCH